MAENTRTQRGNATLTALSLTSLLGFGALAVDVSYQRVAHLQLEIALEAGVLGGSAYLDGTPAGVTSAIAETVALANANLVYGGLELATEDVEIGYYDAQDGTFDPRAVPNTDADAAWINYVRVDHTHDGISTILAGAAFGQQTMSANARVTAYRDLGGPAGAVDCYLPIVFPSCLFPTDPTVNPDPIHVALQSAVVDNGAWATFDSPTNPNTVNAMLNGSCDSAQQTETMNLINGNPTPVGTYLASLMNVSAAGSAVVDPWPYTYFPDGPPNPRVPPDSFSTTTSAMQTAYWGNTMHGPIALVDLGGSPGDCSGASNFNQDRQIVGFTYGYIFDVRNSGSASQRGVMIQLDFTGEYEFGEKVDGVTGGTGNVVYPPEPPILID